MRLGTSIVRVLLAVGLAADAGLAVGGARARAAAARARSPFQRGEVAVALPQGYLFDTSPYRPPVRYPCALIQYTTIFCPYCNDNWQAETGLARRAAAAGCVVIMLAPSPDQLPTKRAHTGAAAVALVRPAWLEQFPRLELEPTTILLGPGGRILWHQEGVLSPADIAAADRVLRGVRR